MLEHTSVEDEAIHVDFGVSGHTKSVFDQFPLRGDGHQRCEEPAVATCSLMDIARTSPVFEHGVSDCLKQDGQPVYPLVEGLRLTDEELWVVEDVLDALHTIRRVDMVSEGSHESLR